MVYIGVSGRILINLEALNMAESAGNVTRHKRAPIIVEGEKEGATVYILKNVPVVSGQSIAHGYQELLATIAMKKGKPVCPYCSRGVFVKHASDDIIKKIRDMDVGYASELLTIMGSNADAEDKIHRFEKKVIENCIVEDVGGFLYTGKTPVKRSSRFQAGYMIPSMRHHLATGSETLFHVRSDPSVERGRQAIYYVESGSSLYTITMALDLDGVGCTSAIKRECLEDKRERMEIALNALALLIGNMQWGAKKSRFLPHWQAESLVVTVSHPLSFNPTPGHDDDYILDTVRRARVYASLLQDLSGYIDIYYYRKSGSTVKEPDSGATRVEDPVEAILRARDKLDDVECQG